jgi:hypothetical protein
VTPVKSSVRKSACVKHAAPSSSRSVNRFAAFRLRLLDRKPPSGGFFYCSASFLLPPAFGNAP